MSAMKTAWLKRLMTAAATSSLWLFALPAVTQEAAPEADGPSGSPEATPVAQPDTGVPADETAAPEDVVAEESDPTPKSAVIADDAPPEPAAAPAEAAETAAPADEAPAPPEEPEKKASWTDHIKVKGDFRYRFEIIDTKNMELRYRHRIRARLGVIATVLDDLEIGIQAATGSDDPVSTNQTLDNAFSTKPFQLDLGYAAYRPSAAPGLALVAGKMKNPFFCVSKSELIWDPDLTPEGIALGYTNKLGMAEPFVQTAGFFVEERSSERDSWILGAQGGIKLTFLDGMLHVLGGVGYIDHTNIKGSEVYFDETDNMGNSAALSDPDGYDPTSDEDPALVYLNDYNLVEGFFEIGGKAGRFPWGVFATTVVNVGADDDNLGWLAGGRFGKVEEALDFDIRYIYRQVDHDAVVGIFTDSDFRGGGAGGTGHEWNLGLGLAKHVKLAATYFLNERPLDNHVVIDGVAPETGDEVLHRFQLDFKFKF